MSTAIFSSISNNPPLSTGERQSGPGGRIEQGQEEKSSLFLAAVMISTAENLGVTGMEKARRSASSSPLDKTG